MSRRLLVLVAAAGILGLGIWWGVSRATSGPDLPVVPLSESRTRNEAEEGLCPWRNPDADLKQFFPTATVNQEESLILSRYRQEIAKRLGRVPTGEENLMRIYRIQQGKKTLGTILPRRIRGESGVIELVLAVDTEGIVLGAKLQRLREPDDVAKTLRAPTFLGAFHGKTARSEWKLGKDFAPVSEAAHPSARALLDGARTALILLDTGDKAARQTHKH
jgi:hypothetical protein